MARRVKLVRTDQGDVEAVDAGPVVPRKSVENPRFIVQVHHKRRKQLPEWMMDNPAFKFENTFRKPRGPTKDGDRMRHLTDLARRLVMEKGMTQEKAAEAVADAFEKLGGVLLRKRKEGGKRSPHEIAKTILKNLQQDR